MLTNCGELYMLASCTRPLSALFASLPRHSEHLRLCCAPRIPQRQRQLPVLIEAHSVEEIPGCLWGEQPDVCDASPLHLQAQRK